MQNIWAHHHWRCVCWLNILLQLVVQSTSSHGLTAGRTVKREATGRQEASYHFPHNAIIQAPEFGLVLQPSVQHPFLPHTRIWWLGPCWRQDQPLWAGAWAERWREGVKDAFLSLKSSIAMTIFVVDVIHCCDLSVIDVSHSHGHLYPWRRPLSWPSLLLTSAIIAAYPSSTLAIVLAVSVFDVGNCHCHLCCWHRPSFLGHHCCWHRHRHGHFHCQCWPLSLPPPLLRSAIVAALLPTSAIFVAVSVVNVGHCPGRHHLWRWPSLWPFLLLISSIVMVISIVNVGHCCGCCHCWCRHGHLQSHCCCQGIVHIIVKLIELIFVFSSFNDKLDMCCLVPCRPIVVCLSARGGALH